MRERQIRILVKAHLTFVQANIISEAKGTLVRIWRKENSQINSQSYTCEYPVSQHHFLRDQATTPKRYLTPIYIAALFTIARNP